MEIKILCFRNSFQIGTWKYKTTFVPKIFRHRENLINLPIFIERFKFFERRSFEFENEKLLKRWESFVLRIEKKIPRSKTQNSHPKINLRKVGARGILPAAV